MPQNRNALIRYKTIDLCLQNPYRKWTLEDLIDACSEALYEYEGNTKGVSKRTIQLDIQTMRSDKLGYNAPIVVVDKKYYTYEDKGYSITNTPINKADLNKLSESIEILKQFKGFSHFKEIEDLVQKIEDHVHTQKNKANPIIDFEKNEDLKGLGFLDEIYDIIIRKHCIKIWYKSFRAAEATPIEVRPLILKEWRNRWYVIGRTDKQRNELFFALDRIEKIERVEKHNPEASLFDAKTYFKDAIGITIFPNQKPIHIEFIASHISTPYLRTKPLHSSQKHLKDVRNGSLFSIDVVWNFELEKELLSFGENIKIISPENLKRLIQKRIDESLSNYICDLPEEKINRYLSFYKNSGYAFIPNFYTSYTLNKVKHLIEKYRSKSKNKSHEFEDVFDTIKSINSFILNENMDKLLGLITKSKTWSKSIIKDNPKFLTSNEFPEVLNQYEIVLAIPLDTHNDIAQFIVKQPAKDCHSSFKDKILSQEIHEIQILKHSIGGVILFKRGVRLETHLSKVKEHQKIILLGLES